MLLSGLPPKVPSNRLSGLQQTLGKLESAVGFLAAISSSEPIKSASLQIEISSYDEIASQYRNGLLKFWDGVQTSLVASNVVLAVEFDRENVEKSFETFTIAVDRRRLELSREEELRQIAERELRGSQEELSKLDAEAATLSSSFSESVVISQRARGDSPRSCCYSRTRTSALFVRESSRSWDAEIYGLTFKTN